MSRTLVYKSSKNYNSDVGSVVPIAVEEDDGIVRLVSPGEYPNNNRIFISKEYSKIDDNYGDYELFLLTTVNESHDTEGSDIPSRSRYYSMGYYAAPLDANTYLPIVAMSMPDVASGRVEQAPLADIGSRSFFILSNSAVSGPFTAQAEEDGWLLTPLMSLTPLGLSNYHVAQFELEQLERNGLIIRSSMGANERMYFTSLKKAKELIEFDSQDYISDSSLIRFYSKMDYGKGISSLTKSEAVKLTGIIDQYKKKNKQLSNDDRTKRLESVLDEYLRSNGVGADVVQNYLNNTKDGKLFLDQYVADNRGSLLKEKMAAIEIELMARREKIERDFAEVTGRLESRKQDLSNFEIEFEKRKALSREQEQSELRDRNNNLMAEIEASKQTLTQLKEEVGVAKTLAQMLEEHNTLKNKTEYLNEDYYKLKNQVSQQQNLIRSPQIGDKLLEFKTLHMLLNGITPDSVESHIKPITIPSCAINLDGETRKSFISSLKSSLDSTEGRPFTYDEMANLTLCTMQSFLTIFSGPPGTGKTSSVHRFADALGLVAPQKTSLETDNFLSIPVGRGWVSSRDLLGFYNSLKNTYQPSRSGLFQFLKAFNDSAPEKNIDEHLKLVLLDEANLSSIEHYWSDFLAMCDTFETGQKIDLGMPGTDDRYLNIPTSLRFIATINNDATVEALSERLINRAPVIVLGHGADSVIGQAQGEILSGSIPYSELKGAFCPSREDEELNSRESIRLDQILDLLTTNNIKGSQVYVSKRKINAITRYCYIANQLSYKTEPLDFAIAQHILPSIKGHGQGMRERMNKLESKLSEFDFTNSKKIVQTIIETGDEFSDSYSFF
jgi:DNA polymerase III delta prime subunit